MSTASSSTSRPRKLNWQFPCVQAQFHTHKFPGEIAAVGQNNEWLTLSVGRSILLHRLKYLNWQQPHREFRIGFIPQQLLLAGIDSRYIMAINHDGYYEMYDRVTSDLYRNGQFPSHNAKTQYQILNQQYLLVSGGRTHQLYAIAAMDQPMTRLEMSGELLTTVFHEAAQTLYCVTAHHQRFAVNRIAVAGIVLKLINRFEDSLQFAGLFCNQRQALLQALDDNGQLRLMFYDLMRVQLIGQQEKSLAYQGIAALHPRQPWAATDLGNGILVWDTQSADPVALLQFPPPLTLLVLTWLDTEQLLFVHGDMVELWSFYPTDKPFANSFNLATTTTLMDFHRWILAQQKLCGIAVITGAAGVGKTEAVRAYVKDGQSNNIHYMAIPSDATEAMVRDLITPCLGKLFNQIVLDQAENLSLALIAKMHQIALQSGVSIVLVTRNAAEIPVLPDQLYSIEVQLDWRSIAAYFSKSTAPISDNRSYLEQIKPTLEASAFRRKLAAAL